MERQNRVRAKQSRHERNRAEEREHAQTLVNHRCKADANELEIRLRDCGKAIQHGAETIQTEHHAKLECRRQLTALREQNAALQAQRRMLHQR